MQYTRLGWMAAGMLMAAPLVHAQPAVEPYKLGMFRQSNRDFVGLVVNDELVIDLARAGTGVPATLKELIARWDAITAARLAALAADARRTPPGDALRIAQLETLPPIAEPDAILMAARNYVDHANEMANVGRTLGTTSTIDAGVLAGLPGLWTRSPDDQRPNPYLFAKLKSSLSANGRPIVLPPGRTNIDYECELVAVIGKPARRVAVEDALDYVFGYMAMNDVSDRAERADGRYGSDWLAGKSQDTFGPSGPFIVPAAFVGDPQNLTVRFTLSGEVMQDGNTAQMVHTVRDLVAYASSIATLQPGDLIGTGTPGGVGEGRTPPVYLKDCDRAVCTIEKIGTLANPVQAAN
jgi:2,4-diketo-3-deoxy-L-fuconate hydrolase